MVKYDCRGYMLFKCAQLNDCVAEIQTILCSQSHFPMRLQKDTVAQAVTALEVTRVECRRFSVNPTDKIHFLILTF